jgi:3-hydroxyisobutyrate dehydrogenase-like beta-hydroxyacid dehydrogenase
MPNQTPLPAPSVGLIGLGLMGRGMGLSLRRAGHSLGIVAHRRRETAQELIGAGAWEAADAQALAKGCDAIVLCLPSREAVEAVLFGPQGIAAAGKPGLLIIECSTLTPVAARDFAQRLAPIGIAFVDAPLTRGPNEALQGKLNTLVGGDAAAVQRALPVLAAFCEKSFAFGATGNGYAAKLISNFLAFSNLVAVAEAMGTAAKAGLDMATLMQAIGVSGGQSRVLDGLSGWLVDGSPSRSKVTLATAHKDVDYYLQQARALGSAGPFAEEVLRRLTDGLAVGLGEQFTPHYLQHVAQLAGASLPQNKPQG